jgi:hypothetical protein
VLGQHQRESSQYILQLIDAQIMMAAAAATMTMAEQRSGITAA